MKFKLSLFLLLLSTAMFVCGAEKNVNKPAVLMDSFGYPIEAISKGEISIALKSKDFAKLNNIIDDYKRDVDKNIKYEYKINDIINSFSSNDTSFQQILDEWQKSFPEKYQPYIARAYFNFNLGQNIYNNLEKNEKNSERINSAKKHFGLAEQDAFRALKYNKNVLPAYSLLISIYKYLGLKEDKQLILQKANELYQNSFLIKEAYISSLETKWGYELKDIENYAQECQFFASKNSKIAVLLGYSAYEKGNLEMNNMNYEEAVNNYNKALSFGEYNRFLAKRGEAYLELGKYSSAIIDLNRAVELRTEDYFSLLLRSKAYFKMGNLNGTMQSLLSAESLKPKDSSIIAEKRKFCEELIKDAKEYINDKKYKQAIEKCNGVLTIDLSFYEAYFYKGVSFFELQQFENGEEQFRKVIDFEPSYFNAFKYLDRILSKRKDYFSIINFWTKYITKVPNDAEAYKERSGAYFNKGEYEAALNDAKKSAELGSDEGKMIYEKLKKRMGK